MNLGAAAFFALSIILQFTARWLFGLVIISPTISNIILLLMVAGLLINLIPGKDGK